MAVRFQSLISRMRAFVHRRGFDARLREELRLHAELLAEEHMRNGMPPGEARRRARVELGGLDQLQEENRDARGFRWLEDLAQDARYALRQFRRSPGFTAVALLIIAIGIGGATAIFSFVDAAMLKPFPYRDADRLVDIREPTKGPGGRTVGGPLSSILAWTRETRCCSEMAIERMASTYNLTGPSLQYAEQVRAVRVSANYFELLGVRPQLGRTFSPEESRAGNESVAVLSNGLWKSNFGADPKVVGKRIFLNGSRHEIIGVLPAGIREPRSGARTLRVADLWLPIVMSPDGLKAYSFVRLTGRLKPGVTPAQASDDLTRAYSAIGGKVAPWERAAATLLRDSIVWGKTRPILLLLFGAGGFVLLIACTNLASLLLARDSARRQEVAIRLSLGAGRLRLLRQFLTEIVLLSALGGLLGICLSLAFTGAIRRMQPPDLMPMGTEAYFDFRVFLFGLALALLTGLLFGLVPAWRLARGSSAAVAEGQRGYFQQMNPGRRRGFGAALIVSEVGLAVTLLIGSALMVRSFMRLLGVDTGFHAGNILTGRIELPASRYQGAPEIRAYQAQFLERLHANPAFRSVALANSIPLSGRSFDAGITVEGARHGAMFFEVTPEYQGIMGLRVLRGRWLSVLDGPASPRVVVVSESFARLYLPGQDPLGKRVRSSLLGDQEWTIAGVVAPVKYLKLEQKEDSRGWNEMYVPVAQAPDKALAGGLRNFFFVAQTRPGRDTGIPALRSIVAGIDRDLAVSNIKSMQKLLDDSVATPRFQTWVFAGFGLVALLLTSLGVYGVLAYSVS